MAAAAATAAGAVIVSAVVVVKKRDGRLEGKKIHKKKWTKNVSPDLRPPRSTCTNNKKKTWIIALYEYHRNNSTKPSCRGPDIGSHQNPKSQAHDKPRTRLGLKR